VIGNSSKRFRLILFKQVESRNKAVATRKIEIDEKNSLIARPYISMRDLNFLENEQCCVVACTKSGYAMSQLEMYLCDFQDVVFTRYEYGSVRKIFIYFPNAEQAQNFKRQHENAVMFTLFDDTRSRARSPPHSSRRRSRSRSRSHSRAKSQRHSLTTTRSDHHPSRRRSRSRSLMNSRRRSVSPLKKKEKIISADSSSSSSGGPSPWASASASTSSPRHRSKSPLTTMRSDHHPSRRRSRSRSPMNPRRRSVSPLKKKEKIISADSSSSSSSGGPSPWASASPPWPGTGQSAAFVCPSCSHPLVVSLQGVSLPPPYEMMMPMQQQQPQRQQPPFYYPFQQPVGTRAPTS
jgi:hypothetical protein